MIAQYEENFSAFVSSIDAYAVISKVSDSDFPYIYAVLKGFSNPKIAKAIGVSIATVNNRLQVLYEKLGVNSKRELKEYLLENM